MIEALLRKKKEIASACVRREVARLEAFGSALGPDFAPGKSDIDLLVEFKPMAPYSRVDAYFGLLEDLRALLETDVDLVMAGAVRNRYIFQNIERTKQLLYAA